MANRYSPSFPELFGRLFAFLLKNRSFGAEKESTGKNGNPPADKYFSLMLGEFFNLLGSRDSENEIPRDSDSADNRSVFDSNPMLDLLKKHEKADTPDMHDDENGKSHVTRQSSEYGEKLSDTEGDKGGIKAESAEDGEESFNGKSDTKLGHTNQHSRVSAKLSSVVSEADVPEYVVFDEIGQAKQIIDWRRILRQNANYEVDWSYRNAVVEDGIVRPTLESVSIAQTEILLDTSGSIDEPLLKRFLQECRNILPYSRIRVGCFDTQFYGFKDIKTPKDLEDMVFEGRHGTSFTTALNAFSGRVDNRIIFTDGEASMPSKRMDVIWIVFGGKKISPNGGRVFYVDDELLEKMKNGK